MDHIMPLEGTNKRLQEVKEILLEEAIRENVIMVNSPLYRSSYLYFFQNEEQHRSFLAWYNSMVNDSSTKKAKKCSAEYGAFLRVGKAISQFNLKHCRKLANYTLEK